MHLYDWLTVSVICALSLFVGLLFTKRATKDGAHSFFAGNHNLPWWAIGFSNSATYSSNGAVFIMLILVFGLSYNWIWWGSWIIWMPLVAIIWAPMWRRLKIVTTAELIELRYGTPMSGIARKLYALVNIIIAILVIAYITGFFAKAIEPLVPWSEFEILAVFGIITLIYTLFGGLTSVVFVDVMQFGIMWIGTLIFMFFALEQSGGLAEVIEKVSEIRPEGLVPFPPTESMPLLLFGVIVLQGFFFAGSPTAGEGMTAQRFMAAKNERHAIGGQLFNAFLALSFRILPFIGLGMVAMSLFWSPELIGKLGAAPEGITVLENPLHAWAELVMFIDLPNGFRGLLLAVEMVAFMSTLSSLINWGGSFVVNDFYKKTRPAASKREEIWASRFTTLVIFVLAGLVAVLWVEGMVAWFLFINVAMVTFLLPLAWFRFFWWRFNVWGELAAVILGLPAAILVWFVFELKDQSAITQGLGILGLLLLSIVLLIIITLLTPAESQETLERFYRKCKPPGLWRKVREQAKNNISKNESNDDLFIKSIYGIGVCAFICITTNLAFIERWTMFSLSLLLSFIFGYLLLRKINKSQ